MSKVIRFKVLDYNGFCSVETRDEDFLILNQLCKKDDLFEVMFSISEFMRSYTDYLVVFTSDI